MKRSEAEKTLEQDIKGLLEVGLYTHRDIASFCIYRLEQLGMIPPESEFYVNRNLGDNINITVVEKERKWETE